MKFFVAAAVAVAALISQASAATCSSAVLSALLTDQYIDQCSSDSGYVFTAASKPDQATVDKMCASSACKGLLADAQGMSLSECTLPVGDNINLLADLIDYVPAHCPSTSTDSETTDAPAAADAPTSTDSPTVTAAPSTPATAAPTEAAATSC
ncbi:unnamed protein product [Phytophthora fragariaefolia]|uniref:Elicitin n=1 Tax=Phytophthora fragariaefolia TaxID=1490495 RepID=A0A9W7CUH5_9STRA|nr:unnamed protein product [Phytophthora fragariaefolia]